jgi:hypothetical protein
MLHDAFTRTLLIGCVGVVSAVIWGLVTRALSTPSDRWMRNYIAAAVGIVGYWLGTVVWWGWGAYPSNG